MQFNEIQGYSADIKFIGSTKEQRIRKNIICIDAANYNLREETQYLARSVHRDLIKVIINNYQLS